MSQITSSERIQMLVAGYVLGELSSDEAAELTRLMTEHPSLIEDIAELQDVSEFMQDITEVAPPPTLRSKVLRSDVRPAKPQKKPDSTSPHRLSWSRVGNAIAAVLVVALGVNNYRLWQTLTAERAKSAQVNPGDAQPLTYALTSPANPGTASIVVDPATLEAQLTAQNLIPLPSDKVYAVWTLPQPDVPVTTNANGAILADVFRVSAQGDAVTTLSIPAVHRRPGAVAKMAISIEEATSPQQNTGSVVLLSQ